MCLILSTDSSDDALAPETLPMKLLCVSHTEYAATRIPCPAPTGMVVKPDYITLCQ